MLTVIGQCAKSKELLSERARIHAVAIDGNGRIFKYLVRVPGVERSEPQFATLLAG